MDGIAAFGGYAICHFRQLRLGHANECLAISCYLVPAISDASLWDGHPRSGQLVSSGNFAKARQVIFPTVTKAAVRLGFGTREMARVSGWST